MSPGRDRCRSRVGVHVVHTAGLSPAEASPEAIIAVDLTDTAHVLEAFGRVIAPGCSGIVVESQASHMLPPLPADHTRALADAAAADLAGLSFLQPDDHPLRRGVRVGQIAPTSSGCRPPVSYGLTAEPG